MTHSESRKETREGHIIYIVNLNLSSDLQGRWRWTDRWMDGMNADVLDSTLCSTLLSSALLSSPLLLRARLCVLYLPSTKYLLNHLINVCSFFPFFHLSSFIFHISFFLSLFHRSPILQFSHPPLLFFPSSILLWLACICIALTVSTPYWYSLSTHSMYVHCGCIFCAFFLYFPQH